VRPKGFLSASGIAFDGNLTKTDSGRPGSSTRRDRHRGAELPARLVERAHTTKAADEYEGPEGEQFYSVCRRVKVVATPEFRRGRFCQRWPPALEPDDPEQNYYGLSGLNVNDRYLFDGLVRWDGSSLFVPRAVGRRTTGRRAYRLSQASITGSMS